MDVWEEQTAARPRAEPSISHRREARRQVTAAAAGKLRDGLRLDNNNKKKKNGAYFEGSLSVLIHCVSDGLEKCGALKRTARRVPGD